jgi:FkbM family methyltransferase
MSATNPDALTPNDSQNEPAPPVGIARRNVVFGGLAGLAGLFAGTGCCKQSDKSAAGEPAAAGGGDATKPDPSLNPPRRLSRAVFDSYAQCGEDLIMSWLLTKTPLELKKPSYLDIGTHDPILSNNTYTFYVEGGRGVLIEPNPALADRIKSERPEDKLLSVGVGIDDTPELDYYMFNDSQLNTFSKEDKDRVLKVDRVKLEKTIKVPLITINRVIAEHMGGKAPDALSIDIEGWDLKVLQTLDFAKYRPKVICTETIITTTFDHDPEIPKFLESKGYELWGRTFANSIFMDKNVIPRKK